MSALIEQSGPSSPGRHALPDPGESATKLALPTVGIFLAALAAFVASTVLAVQERVPVGATILINSVVVFVMFTVVHDASHYAISSTRWVNGLFGRLAWVFVSPAVSFPTMAFIHIEHHRHSNDDDNDPDTYASHAPAWQLPFRWVTVDLAYVEFYLRRLRSRPVREVAESAVMLVLFITALVLVITTGHLWIFAVVFLIPNRIGLVFLAWWFDWLPHHGLEDTQRSNRYGATRARVGMEWLLTPLMLSQNYHLVHHLHPSIPFYRYWATWRRNEEAYLERNPAIATVFGKSLNPDEFREWKELNKNLGRVLPIRMPKGSSATHGVFHRIPVASVDPITADSTLVTFAVPEGLRDEFGFEPGQHVTVKTDLGGQGVRRNYSICAPATRAQLRIAVKRIPDGAFSTFVHEQLKAGDVLELMTPTGRFGTRLDPLNTKNYVGIAAGSGITPVLSILETVLEVETESRFTLIYGNHNRDTTMFRHDIERLESRYSDRFEVIHVLSDDPLHTPELRGIIDREKLESWLATILPPDTIDAWFLCGPMGLSATARDLLIEHGVDPDRIRLELFTGYSGDQALSRDYGAATVTFLLSGRRETAELESGESVLEAALQVRGDTPYACMGGACGTCRAKLLDGTIEMDQNFALGQDDLDAGYVLTCQSHPTSSDVTVDYDA